MEKFKAKPMFNGIFTTAHETKKIGNILIPDGKSTLNPEQTVIAVGPNSILHVGDTVTIQLDNFIKIKTEYKNSAQQDLPENQEIGKVKVFDPPIWEIAGKQVLFVTDRDVLWYEEKE